MITILIIEDEIALRELYKKKFELEKFNVITAFDGEDGIRKIKNAIPDVVLLDLFLPKLTGFDVLKEVKSNPELKNIPVVVLTNISVDVEDLLNNWGATDFILKANATPEDVVVRVNQVLSKKLS
jgi:DNA-binding response OmpR family regulator